MPDLQNVKASAANLLWFLYSAGMARKWQHATFDVAGATACCAQTHTLQ